jgi:hypothetical protein
MFKPDPKYKSLLLAKTSRYVAQLGENKGRWKERTEKANNSVLSFFLNFSLIFPKDTSWNQTFFYFFTIFFIFFSEQGSQKMQPQKLAPITEVGGGLQKYNTFSEKHAKTLTIFFFIFLNFFGNFDETRQGEAICCWAWITVER